MPKTGKFVHNAVHSGLSIAANTTYATARRHNLDLYSDYKGILPAPAYRGKLGSLFIRVNTIAGAATTLTMRLTSDASGDKVVFGDTTATISTGVTTATDGAVTFKIDSLWSADTDNLYCFWKLDAGTATVENIQITWEE
jgi:hypothetical protein